MFHRLYTRRRAMTAARLDKLGLLNGGHQVAASWTGGGTMTFTRGKASSDVLTHHIRSAVATRCPFPSLSSTAR
jgi:hypothetical protein